MFIMENNDFSNDLKFSASSIVSNILSPRVSGSPKEQRPDSVAVIPNITYGKGLQIFTWTINIIIYIITIIV